MIFQEKTLSCYILLTEQISSSDCLFFLINWTICVLPDCYAKPRQKFKYLEKKKKDLRWGFKDLRCKDLLTFFFIFKSLSVAKNCHRHESVPLIIFFTMMNFWNSEEYKELFPLLGKNFSAKNKYDKKLVKKFLL